MNTANNRKEFYITHVLDTGERLEGKFTAKRLSVAGQAQLGVKRSQLSGGMYCVRSEDGEPTGQGIDAETDFLNAMLAHLSLALIQKPQWWNLDEICDMDLVAKVYKEVADFQASFFRSKNQETGKGTGQVGEGTGGAESSASGSGNGLTPVVGQQVQAALDA